MVRKQPSRYVSWVQMMSVKFMTNRKKPFLMAWVMAVCILTPVLVALGCAEIGKKAGSDNPKGGSAAGLAKLQFAEVQQDVVLYELVFSNAGSQEISDIRYAQGQFLMNDKGAFCFEQGKRDPQQCFSIYFRPDREILVLFPKLKIAYRGSPAILSGREGDKLVAAYDGLRMVLCLSDVWSKPEENSIEVSSSGDNLTLQQPDRPFRWNVEMETGASLSPITEMRARSGFSQLCQIQRRAGKMQEVKGNKKDAFMRNNMSKLDSANEWSVILSGHTRQSDLVFTPYPVKNREEKDKLHGLLEPPKLDPSFQVQELTLDLIQDWMGLR